MPPSINSSPGACRGGGAPWRTIGIVALTAILAACLEGGSHRPAGSECDSDDDCGGDLVCRYGRCRSACTFERDCPEGMLCLSVPEDPTLRVCALPDEGSCTETPELCAERGLVCAADGQCHDPTSALLLEIEGTWHGDLFDDLGLYSGCLCITFDAAGIVVEGASFFTDAALGVAGSGVVTGVGDAPALLQLDGDEATIELTVDSPLWGASRCGGAGTVTVEGSLRRMDGVWTCPDWAYSGTISLEKGGQSCEERTGIAYGC